jgi:uncharacterized protein with von Willebrand factor type A (vWA) domain
MTDSGMANGVFGVEQVELDLPALVGALNRRLRDAGMPTTTARAADFAHALTLVRPMTRRRLYWTARALFVSDQAQLKAFDAVFSSVFGTPAEITEFEPDEAETVASPPDDRPRSEHDAARSRVDTLDRLADTSSAPPGEDDEHDERAEIEVPLAMASEQERLGAKSFDALEPHELAQLYRLMSRLELVTPLRRTRRHEKSRHGARVDMRRTLRASMRTGGEPIRIARRRRRIARRRLVMLCDISGSMEPYARAYLQFLTSAAGSSPNAEAFVFATRLTRLTRALASRRPERAIQRAAAAAPDWSSGTRIGDALKAFNDLHGRRGMARGAVVVILSDGWERGDPMLVAREMQRLGRLAHRIVWVNPRISANAFSVQAGGMTAAMPYCDALVSGHSFKALHEVVEAIGVQSWGRAGAPGAGLKRRASIEAEDVEPWASATPVAGSSVAMPSGHGPARGNTTPGWVGQEGER